MVALLMVLLSMGPFLHTHLGASMVSGFHMDGVQHLGQTPTASTDKAQAQWGVNPDEPPVMGVATSLPNADHEGMGLIDMTGLLTAILFVSLLRLCKIDKPVVHLAWPPRTYQAGWPPPALAPPASNG